MRILQLIDSLEAGGAERMAVNYANALANEIEFSGLITTRKEGVLKKQLDEKVDYLFLNKKTTVDFVAVIKLRKYIVKNEVQIIQAHSSSFFLAVLVKLSLSKIKIIWHDHYGNSDFLENRPPFFLKTVSFLFSGIIAVNEKLKTWSLEFLHFNNVIYLSNFAVIEKGVKEQTILKGQPGKRIVYLANLRSQKNHFLLLEVAKKMQLSYPEWTFHLIGKDFEDDYSKQIKKIILDFNLENNVFIYGSKQDISIILAQADIAVLTSQTEGLPVALLEYGLCKKAVVVTRVGELPLIIQHGKNGFLVQSNDLDVFYSKLVDLINNKLLQESFAENLHQTIVEHFSETSIIKQYIHWIRTTIIVNE